MQPIKTCKNTVFDVLYDDGTKYRVNEGVLIEVNESEVTFHNGTNRLSVIFAAVESLFEVISVLGAWDLFDQYIQQNPSAEDTT